MYRGVRIGERVRLVGPSEPADYIIAHDGRLVPAP
jgi:Pyruvate/2-oxoacid:ferredoxin oxidoreductase gamma subunit